MLNVSTISVQKSISDSIYPTENIERGGRETTGKSAGERSGFHSHEIPDSSRSSNFTCFSKHARNSSQRAEVKCARKQRGQKKRGDDPLEKTLVSSGHASPWNKTQERPKKKKDSQVRKRSQCMAIKHWHIWPVVRLVRAQSKEMYEREPKRVGVIQSTVKRRGRCPLWPVYYSRGCRAIRRNYFSSMGVSLSL